MIQVRAQMARIVQLPRYDAYCPVVLYIIVLLNAAIRAVDSQSDFKKLLQL